MVTFEEVQAVLLFLFACLSCYFGYKAYGRNVKQDNDTTTQLLTSIQVKFETIKDGMTEIKTDLKNVKEDIKDLGMRMAICEQQIKSAHKRLDEYESRLDRKES